MAGGHSFSAKKEFRGNWGQSLTRLGRTQGRMKTNRVSAHLVLDLDLVLDVDLVQVHVQVQVT